MNNELRRVPLEEIESLSNGEAIPSVEGKIVDVYERKHGENAYGEWSFQDATISDGTTVAKIKAQNLHDLSELKGRSVVIECSQTKKHGLTGVSKLVEDYNNLHYHKIKLTGSCKIREKEDERDEIPGLPTISKPELPEPYVRSPVDKAREEAMMCANGMLICLEAALYVAKAWQKKHEDGDVGTWNILSIEHFQAICSTFFIHLDRTGAIASLPKTKIP